jgi:HAD superfamily hydrolase (TIGR01509 family)
VDLPLEDIVDFLNRRVAEGVAAGIPWQPGAEQVLTDLHDAGVPMALVTSSFRMLAEPFAAAAGRFDVVVSGDEVTRAKPDPEPYLTAARLLGVDIADCVAVEDSRAGIASALSSGARAVAIEVMQPVAAQPGLTRIASLTDLTLPTLARIVAGEVLDLRRAG